MSAIEREISCPCIGATLSCGNTGNACALVLVRAMQESETPIGKQHHALELHHRTNDLISDKLPSFQGLAPTRLLLPHLTRSISYSSWPGLLLLLLAPECEQLRPDSRAVGRDRAANRISSREGLGRG